MVRSVVTVAVVEDDVEDDEEEEEGAWKVAPLWRDMLVLTVADEGVTATEDLLERRGWLRDITPGAL